MGAGRRDEKNIVRAQRKGARARVHKTPANKFNEWCGDGQFLAVETCKFNLLCAKYKALL